MMPRIGPEQVMAGLPELRPQSRIRLRNDNVLLALTGALGVGSDGRYRLIISTRDPARQGNWVSAPRNGTSTLLQNLHSKRRLWTAHEFNSTMRTINHQLKGGDSYPVLKTALGLMPVGGSIFSMLSTALDLTATSHSVIIRDGDEVWQIEEIGKSGRDVVHVVGYFVVDPYRAQAPEKGWFIHEERTRLTLLPNT